MADPLAFTFHGSALDRPPWSDVEQGSAGYGGGLGDGALDMASIARQLNLGGGFPSGSRAGMHQQDVAARLLALQQKGEQFGLTREDRQQEAQLRHEEALMRLEEARANAAATAAYREDTLGERELGRMDRRNAAALSLAQSPELGLVFGKQGAAIQKELLTRWARDAGVDIAALPPDEKTAALKTFAAQQGGGAATPTTASGAPAAATGGATAAKTPETPMARDVTAALYGTDVARAGAPPAWAIAQLYGGKSTIPAAGPAGYYNTKGKFLGPAYTAAGEHIPMPKGATGLRGGEPGGTRTAYEMPGETGVPFTPFSRAAPIFSPEQLARGAGAPAVQPTTTAPATTVSKAAPPTSTGPAPATGAPTPTQSTTYMSPLQQFQQAATGARSPFEHMVNLYHIATQQARMQAAQSAADIAKKRPEEITQGY